MKNEKIVLEWKEGKKLYKTEVDRKAIYDIMDSIRKGFWDDNQISTKFCEDIIPEADGIFIDKDRNNQIDVPFIEYRIGNLRYVLTIIRYHKIIWSILNRYCAK